MAEGQISDLAKAILAGERITPTTGIVANNVPPTSCMNTSAIPTGAIPIPEGARLVCDSVDYIPKGAATVNFSEDEKKK